MAPDSPFSFMRFDRSREAVTEIVTSCLHMTEVDVGLVQEFAPFLIVTLLILVASAFAGAIVVRKDLSVAAP